MLSRAKSRQEQTIEFLSSTTSGVITWKKYQIFLDTLLLSLSVPYISEKYYWSAERLWNLMSECSSSSPPLGYTSLKSAGKTSWWKPNSYNKCTAQGLAVDVSSRKNGTRNQDTQQVLPWQNNNLHEDPNRCTGKKAWSVLIKKQTEKNIFCLEYILLEFIQLHFDSLT